MVHAINNVWFRERYKRGKNQMVFRCEKICLLPFYAIDYNMLDLE